MHSYLEAENAYLVEYGTYKTHQVKSLESRLIKSDPFYISKTENKTTAHRNRIKHLFAANPHEKLINLTCFVEWNQQLNEHISQVADNFKCQ